LARLELSGTIVFQLPVTTRAAVRFDWSRHLWCAEDGPGGDSTGPADDELVVAYQRAPDSQSGRDAAGRLLGRYRRRVLIWCRRLIRDPEAAEDLAQESLLSALRSLRAYRERGDFGAWLFMVTRNRCLSELRRRQVPMAGDALLELIADERPRPDQELERKRLGADLEQLVRETLDPLEQDALWLRCYEGLSVDVITRRLAIGEATGARAVLQRARRKLRRVLARNEEDSR
jgi:RNA polymerase sigma-70 factor (ECF subfamily)